MKIPRVQLIRVLSLMWKRHTMTNSLDSLRGLSSFISPPRISFAPFVKNLLFSIYIQDSFRNSLVFIKKLQFPCIFKIPLGSFVPFVQELHFPYKFIIPLGTVLSPMLYFPYIIVYKTVFQECPCPSLSIILKSFINVLDCVNILNNLPLIVFVLFYFVSFPDQCPAYGLKLIHTVPVVQNIMVKLL